MRIQHNIMAMNAYRNYNANTSALSKNLEKLSSGYKINRAGDDAAGLAISEKMRAQITGLNAAQKNVKDGISLVKTAEGAMQEIQDMLNRMDYLATQSANGTYDKEVDRAALQKEVEQLKSEIDRIADSANFNGIKLLDGSWDAGGRSVSGKFSIPPEGKPLGDQTYLRGPATAAQKTEFELDLDTLEINPTDAGAQLKVEIGGNSVTIDLTPNQKYTADDLATAIANKFKDTAANGGLDGKIGDAGKTAQAFTIAASGNKVTFKQTAEPKDASEVVSANLDVKLSYIEKTGATPVVLSNDGIQTFEEKAPDITGTLADATVGGTAAAYTPESSQVEGITVNVTAADAGTGDVKVKVDKAAADKAAQAAGASKLEGLTFKTADAVGSAGNDIKIKIVASGKNNATEAAAAAWDKNSKTVTVTLSSDGGSSGDYDATALTNLIKALGNKSSDGGIDFSNFTVTAAGSEKIAASDVASAGDIGTVTLAGGESQNDMKVTLTSNAGAFSKSFKASEWTGSALAVTGDKGVSVTIDTTKVTASVGDTKVGAVSAASGGKKITMGTLNKDAIKTAATTAKASSGKVTISKNAEDFLELKIGNTIIGKSTAKAPDTSAAATEITFTSDGTAQGTALGNISLASGLTKSDFTAAVETGLTYDAGGVQPGGDKTEVVSSGAMDMTGVTADTANKAATLSPADVTTLKGLFGASGANKSIKVNNEIDVDLTGVADGLKTDNTATVEDLAKAILAKAKTVVDAWNTANGNTKGYTYENLRISTTNDATGVMQLTAGGNLYVIADKTPKTPTPPTGGAKGGVSGNYNAATVANQQGAVAGGGKYASTSFNLSQMGNIGDGSTITIGKETYTFKMGDAYGIDNNTITLDKNLTGNELLNQAGMGLSKMTNSTFSIGHEGNGQIVLDELKDNPNYHTELTTKPGFESLLKFNSVTPKDDTKGLTLQIGDTSDPYNQLKVSIGSMKTTALNINNLDISTAASAADAINTIKAAINSVSGVRGDLGAYQNRLEHTANNLSVMAENITDAESSIRDTDIAEEMMAYTKNNILVQSAQAMLAQANQVPQGVLQLLG